MRAFARIMKVCLFLSILSLPAAAEIYRWKDKDGNLVVSTNPPPPGVKWEKKDTGALESKIKVGDPAQPGVQEVEMKRSNRDIKVIMYMTTWCSVCRKAREYLNSLGVNLVEYDIEKDEQRKKEWLSKADDRKGVPVIDIEGIISHGLNTKEISAALEERRGKGYQY